MTHVVFSLHVYTFLLLLFCLALLAAGSSASLGFGGLETAAMDNALSVFNFAACALYLYLAAGVVYETRGTGAFACGGSRLDRHRLSVRDVPDHDANDAGVRCGHSRAAVRPLRRPGGSPPAG
jgi:hypothetical protein